MRLFPLVILWFAVALVACGGTKGSTAQPAPPQEHDVAEDTITATPDAGASHNAPSQALVAGDCEALLEHIFALIYAQQSRDLPEAQRPSPEDLTVAKDNLRNELLGQCLGADREVFRFDCAMAAQSPEALAACMGEPAGG